MKKGILIITALLIATFVNAQENKDEIDLMQASFGKEKRAIVTEYVKPSETQKDAFWKLYDEYEKERQALGRERIDLIMQHTEMYVTMTNEQAESWTKKVIDLQERTDKLILNYYKKVKGISDGKVASQFYLAENYILSKIRGDLVFKATIR